MTAPGQFDEHLNTLIEAFVHNEATEEQLRELSAWLEADQETAKKIAIVSMIQGRFRAEGDRAFVAEAMAATNHKSDSGFVRRIMHVIREDGGEEATRTVLPVNVAKTGTRTHLRPVSHRAHAVTASSRISEKVIAIPKNRDRSWMFMAGFAALFMLYILGRFLLPHQHEPIARITIYSETATIQRDGQALHFAEERDLVDGDVLACGQEPMRVRYFSDNTTLHFAAETQVRLTMNGKQKCVELLAGRIDAAVAPQPPGNPMLLKTQDAEIKVIGTRFTLLDKQRGTTLEVQEGKVKLTRQNDGAAVEVPAGKSVRASLVDTAPLTLKTVANVSEGLIAHWSFDEGSGNLIRDEALEGHGGTMTNGGRWVQGHSGSAVELSGGAYVDVGSAPQLNFSAGAPFTYSGWFKTTAQFGSIVSHRNSNDEGADIDIAIGQVGGGGGSPGRIAALVRPNGPMVSPFCHVIGGTVNDGAWHHFAVTRNPEGVLELFLDGVSQGKSRAHNSGGSIVTNLRAFGNERFWATIRSTGPHGGMPFEGAIDDFRVYSRVLTISEIQQLSR